MATTCVKKKIFFLVFCLASVCQGMYSTYFVSMLTTIERLYQIQSKTAGAIMSATEVGQIAGSLLIAYYGGKGNKPRWIAACMTLTAIAALISTSPHFLLTANRPTTNIAIEPMLKSPYFTSDLKIDTSSLSSSSNTLLPSTVSLTAPTSTFLSAQDQLCYLNSVEPLVQNSTHQTSNYINTEPSNQATAAFNNPGSRQQVSVGSILVIFFLCLLLIGFGSTAITTLGIPYIDDIVSKEESPLYLGLTIGLKIFGPALGFLLGSFCIQQDVDLFSLSQLIDNTGDNLTNLHHLGNISTTKLSSGDMNGGVGAWWLGLIIISLPLLILALPMYYLSHLTGAEPRANSDLQDITYQAAEDHDIGGSHDFQPHVLTVGDLDVTSNRTFYSDVESSHPDVLQPKSSSSHRFDYNFVNNISLDQPVLTKATILNQMNKEQTKNFDKSSQNYTADEWKRGCLVVNHFGGLESTSFTNDEAKSLHSNYSPTSSSSSRKNKNNTKMNLSSSLSRLIKNKLLLLRMLSGTLHILPIAGFYTFLPKYLTEQFRIAPSSASAISGLAGILFVGLGAFLGGMIIRILNVNSKMMTKWIAASALLYTIGMLILMNIGCPQNQTVYYESDSFTSTDCSTNCKCSNEIYSPVCANGTTYMSPCLAGCKNYTISEDKIIFDECGCSTQVESSLHLDGSEKEYFTHLKQPQQLQGQLNLNVATQGHCLLNCDNLKWYIIIFSLFTLIHASCEAGSMMFNLRCVKSTDRTSALGLITFTSSLLGTIPCSVIYGTLIDLTCIHWDTVGSFYGKHNDPLLSETTTKGACRAYKNESFRFYLHGVTAFVMFLAFIIDYIISRRAWQVNFYDNDDEDLENVSGQKDIVTTCESPLKKSTETI